MKNILFLIFFLSSLSLLAQKEDYNWVLGYDLHPISIEGGEGNLYDFNGDSLSVSLLVKDMNIDVTNASISDADGNLLFYTNGCYIADITHDTMMNGGQLNYPGWIYDNNCGNGDGYTAFQGSMILPMPDSNQIYYLFHPKQTLMQSPIDILGTPFLYTKVDMSQNNGLGAVVKKNQIILTDTLDGEYLTAVRHANGNDWWIVVTKRYSDLYYKILFTSEGVDSIQTQHIGITEPMSPGGSGQSVFSPDGTKYVRYDQLNQLFLFDFDRTTGLLSDFQNLMVSDTVFAGGVAFSPSNRFLYVTSTFYLYQFDMEAEDIQASKVLIDTYDGYQDPFSTTFWKMQLAPDCRIYMNCRSGVRSMHVIQHPDRKGVACGFEQHSLHLPTNNYFGFPNFPNFRLGITPTYPCDSMIAFPTGIEEVFKREVNEIKLYPNPTTGQINMELEKSVEGSIRFFNAVGQEVFQQDLEKGQQSYEWSLEGLGAGVYFFIIKNKERVVLKSGKVVILRE